MSWILRYETRSIVPKILMTDTLGIEMMREGWFAHTANLDNVDDRCADLDYLAGEGRRIDIEYLMSNNFAFGGINTSLIFKRV